MAEETQPTSTPPELHVAPGPHLQDTNFTTRRMMIDVLIGLAPVLLAATIVFKQYVWLQLAYCVVGCVAAEALFCVMRRRPLSLGDFSAVVTGAIIALSLPWNAPPHVGLIAAFVGIGVGKMMFGGVGYNLFNPAMVGRAFVMLSFAGAVGAPAYVQNLASIPGIESIDAMSNATPMTDWKENGQTTAMLQLLLGNTTGSLGETSAVACVLGGLYLCLRRTAAWQLPAGAIVAMIVISSAVYAPDLMNHGLAVFLGFGHWGVLSELLGGAFLYGAFFIITDPVSTPVTHRGKFIFGLGFGALTLLIRKLSAYPEGVMFAVLLMNSLTPLINRWTVPKPFGGPVPERA